MAGGYLSDPSFLNGYLTCALAPLEVRRCRAILQAIDERGLCANAATSGRELRCRLRRAGLDTWGVGLALWFDARLGGIQNAAWFDPAEASSDGGFCRLLPTLTFGTDAADLSRLLVRRGLYSHLPAVLREMAAVLADADADADAGAGRAPGSRSGRRGARARCPPPWRDAAAVLAWHADRLQREAMGASMVVSRRQVAWG